MNAFAYLLGARALDIAREAGSVKRSVPEAPLGPLATTDETAAAWRRWARGGEAPAAAADRLPSPGRPASDPSPSPA